MGKVSVPFDGTLKLLALLLFREVKGGFEVWVFHLEPEQRSRLFSFQTVKIIFERKMRMENTKTSYELRLGKTTYIVCVKQAETAKKPLEKALFDICKSEELGGTSTAQKFNLDNLAKTS